MEKTDTSLSLTPPSHMNAWERAGMAILAIGFLAALVAFLSAKIQPYITMGFAGAFLVSGAVLLFKGDKRHKNTILILLGAGLVATILFFVVNGTGSGLEFSSVKMTWLFFTLVFGLSATGALIYFKGAFGKGPAGIKNNGIFHAEATRKQGSLIWMMGVLFTGFYIVLYWFPENLQGLINLVLPLKLAITGNTNSGQWFLYGLIYTLLVLVMGTRFALKYRHNRYQLIRTLSVSFFQLIAAFLLPAFLEMLNSRGNTNISAQYFSYFFPLDYDAFFPDAFIRAGEGSHWFPRFVLGWSIVMSFIAVPILTYFFGKRWYCSWVCGCGGLAETAGDPFRHLSDKSLKAWQVERVLIYSVLVLITGITALLLLNWKLEFMPENIGNALKTGYGFVISSSFAGVVGTGFYPLLGNRVWCRFGCPQAAVLGILQKYFSRFRITTNGAQCISCGNCSTYCEMGIDVKAYAQRGQNIVRASCVGCGICSAVCPRGVLNLENGPVSGRTDYPGPISVSENGAKILS